jgi:hypothetical protein
MFYGSFAAGRFGKVSGYTAGCIDAKSGNAGFGIGWNDGGFRKRARAVGEARVRKETGRRRKGGR